MKKKLTKTEQAAEKKLVKLEKMTNSFENGALLNAYRKADRTIREQIESFYGKYAKDNKVSYVAANTKLNSSEIKQVKVKLKEYIKSGEEIGLNASYLKQVKSLSARREITRLQALQADIRYQIELLTTNNINNLRKLETQLYKEAYYLEIYDEIKVNGLTGSFARVNPERVKLAVGYEFNGVTFSESLWKNRNNLIRVMQQEIPQAFILGQSVQDLAKNIKAKMNTSYNSAIRLARTETNRLNNQATLDSYKETARPNEYLQILATLDDRTSEICQQMDGVKIPIDEAEVGVTIPPFHPNCRSTTIRVFEGDEEEGERLAKIDGQWEKVEDMSFSSFKEALEDGEDIRVK